MGLFSIRPAKVKKETREPVYTVPQEQAEPQPADEETHEAYVEQENQK
jgi:hypothetical protein